VKSLSDSIISEFKKDSHYRHSIAFHQILEPFPGSYVPFPDRVRPEIRNAYEKSGIRELYSHQGQAFNLASNGKNVVVVTPTASGKTLCYNLPVLNRITGDPGARALYLFPTKALSNDQREELNSLKEHLPDLPKVFTYDGDTQRDIRNVARDSGQIIISNPDMLHTAILPNHTKWVRFFENLKFIIIDELHIYRGVFGSHLAGVMARILRICRFYGSNPQFIASSATIANPKELAETITGQPFELIDENGAPRGRKHFILYNPPVISRELGIRRGALAESVKIAKFFIEKKVKTIVFARSRLNVELLSTYLKKMFPARKDIGSYRGGYLPNERREIERKVRDGEINCIVSTNALELGIDIGGLDVSILTGYPGSMASTRQQSGRAGRKATESLSILVATSSVIDQFLMEHPDYFFSRTSEHAYIDPENLYILLDQLKCAGFEIPFEENEPFHNDVNEYLDYLEEQRVLHREGSRYYWSDRSFPAENISLRTAAGGNFTIINRTGGKHEVIGEIDRPTATELLFEEAIYIHQSRQYQVKKMDYEGRKVYVEDSAVNYYTDAVSRYELEVLRKLSHSVRGLITLHHLEVLVRRITPKFKKIKFHTHENVGFGEIHLPEEELMTTAAAVVFDPVFFGDLSDLARENILLSVANLLIELIPVYLLCDRKDMGYFVEVRSPFFRMPVIYLYDRYPGGIGLSDKVIPMAEELISDALERVSHCACDNGCPSCTGPDTAYEKIKIETSFYLEKILGELAKPHDE
jgi:DEAD/DEAH box helicase domain-containing protein